MGAGNGQSGNGDRRPLVTLVGERERESRERESESDVLDRKSVV